jgi:hypothetical protein
VRTRQDAETVLKVSFEQTWSAYDRSGVVCLMPVSQSCTASNRVGARAPGETHIFGRVHGAQRERVERPLREETVHKKIYRLHPPFVIGAGLLTFILMLQAPVTGYASVNLAWDPSSWVVDGYNVYRSNQSGVYTSAPLNGTTLLTATSFTDSTAQSGTYYYIVRAVASGIESAPSNEIQVNIISTGPVVNAGTNQSITLPATATLTATATDDCLPSCILTYSWAVVSGTGVTLATPNSASTGVSFAGPGIYTFRVTVSDGTLSSTADVNVTVASANPLLAPTGLATQCNPDGTTFTISWNAVAGADNYYVGVDYVANNVSGSWYITPGTDYKLDAYTNTSFTGSVIPAQSYKWWVQGANASSGLGPQSSASFTCKDIIPPTVSITTPSDGTVISNTVRVAVSASDNVGVVGVQYMINGTNLGPEDTIPPYAINWNTKKRPNGVYTLTAVARDAAGNQTTSAPVTVTVNNPSAKSITLTTRTGRSLGDDSETDILAVGYAHAQVQAGATADGLALVTLTSGGDVVSEAFVTPSAPIERGRIYVSVDSTINTGLAIANDGSEAAEISFYFTDNTGADLGHGTFTLEAKHNLAAFVSQAPFNLPVSMDGSLTFTSTAPVAVTALRGFTNQRGDFLMTTLPVGRVGTATDGPSTVLPQFADGGGWSTQVVLMNPTDAPLAGTAQFFGSALSVAGASSLTMTVNGVTASNFNYTIAPRSVIRMVTSNSSADAQVGYVVVTAADNSAAPEGISLLSFSKEGITVSEAGVQGVSAATAFHTYFETRGNLRSALALANASGLPARVMLELVTLDRSATGFTGSMEIPAGGYISRFVDELFPAGPDGSEGILRITSTRPIAAGAVRVRNTTRGDLLITAIPVTNDTSVYIDNSDLIFPLILRGGGYSTDFIGVKEGTEILH